jgi:hypothetical protein
VHKAGNDENYRFHAHFRSQANKPIQVKEIAHDLASGDEG